VIHFLDFEASSLSDESYPIEAGWASLDLVTGIITSESMLITPVVAWTDWNPASQAIHNIERQTLYTDGYTVCAVAQRMSMILGGMVLCDGGAYDEHWNQRLYYAAGEMCPYTLRDYWHEVALRMNDHELDSLKQFMVFERFREPRPHRAKEDAEFLAKLYRDCVTF